MNATANHIHDAADDAALAHILPIGTPVIAYGETHRPAAIVSYAYDGATASDWDRRPLPALLSSYRIMYGDDGSELMLPPNAVKRA